MNKLLRAEEHATQEMEELLADIRTCGLDVLEGEPELASSTLEQRLVAEPEEIDINLVQGAADAANDPVRIYLREMGGTPLLTREGEVDLARRIERGQLWTWKALSRSPLVMRDVMAMGADLKRGLRSIKETVVFKEEEIDEEILEERVKEVTRGIDQVQKHYKSVEQLVGQIAMLPADKKTYKYRISIIIRNLGLTCSERKRLADRAGKTAEIMRSLDRQINDLEKKIGGTRSTEQSRGSVGLGCPGNSKRATAAHGGGIAPTSEGWKTTQA